MAGDFLGKLLVKIVGDNTEFDSSIKESEKTMASFSTRATKVGKGLNRNLTLPIAAAGLAAIKFASDAEESRAKFETAFAGVVDKADEVKKELTDSFGLSSTAAEKLLGNTADLLKGFNASGDQALSLSGTVQKLAVDLASYNNVQGGAERASRILTKALLGNRDGLTELGILIRDTDVKQELLRRGQEKLTGQAKALAVAEATLALALQQTGDAQGDFARTTDSVANQSRIALARAEDLASGFGKLLLPTVAELIGKVNGFVGVLNNLNDGTKQVIIDLALFAAAVGPVTLAVGKLSGALAFLAANPVVAATVAIGGLVVALTSLVAAAESARETQLGEEVEEVANGFGLAAKEAGKLVDTFNSLSSGELQQTERLIADLAEDFGVSTEEVLTILNASSAISGTIKEQIVGLEQLNEERKEQDQLIVNQLENEGKIQVLTEAQLRAKQEAAILAQKEAEAAERRDRLEKDRARVLNEIGSLTELFNQGALTESQLLQDKIQIRQSLIDKIKEEVVQTGIATAEQAALIKEQTSRIDDYTERLTLIEEQEEKNAKAAEEAAKRRKLGLDKNEEQAREFAKTQITIAQDLEEAEKQGQKRRLDALKQSIQERVDIWSDYANTVKNVLSSLSQVAINLNNAQLENTRERLSRLTEEELAFQSFQDEQREAAAQKEINSKTNSIASLLQLDDSLNSAQLDKLIEAEINRLSVLDDSQKTIDQLRAEDLARERSVILERTRLQEEAAQAEAERKEKLAKEERRIQRENAVIQKVAGLFSVAVDTASAIAASVAASPLTFGLPWSAFSAAEGAAQAAVIASQPLPKLANGGFFSGPALIGEAGREFAFPIDGPQGQKAMELMAMKMVSAMEARGPAVTNNSGGNTVNINTLFDLNGGAELTKAAKMLFGPLENEAQRRGTSFFREAV